MTPQLDPDWSSLPDLVPAADAARLLGVKPGSLTRYQQGDRTNRLAPPVYRMGRHAFYDKRDVQAYVEARRAQETAAQRLEARVNESEARVRELEARVEALEGLLLTQGAG